MPVAEIFLAQEDLSNFHAVLAKQPLICLHQQALPNSGTCLLGCHIFQPSRVEPEPTSAKADSAGGNQDNLAAAGLKSGDSVHNRFDPFQGEFALGTVTMLVPNLMTTRLAFAGGRFVLHGGVEIRSFDSVKQLRVRHSPRLSNSN